MFRELTRVKQYFQKVEDVEKMGSRRENLSLDKAAAGRIIKHALVSRASTLPDSNRKPPGTDLGLYCASTDKVAETQVTRASHAISMDNTVVRSLS